MLYKGPIKYDFIPISVPNKQSTRINKVLSLFIKRILTAVNVLVPFKIKHSSLLVHVS